MTSVLSVTTMIKRCTQCGFDAAPEHFKGDLCSICAEPEIAAPEKRDPRRAYGPIVKCRCGCGATFHQFDARGRVKWYSGPGHYNRVRRIRAGAS